MGGSLTLVFIKQLDYIRTWQKSFLTLDVNVGRLCLDFDMLRLCRWRNCTIGCEERLSALSVCIRSICHGHPCTTALAGVEWGAGFGPFRSAVWKDGERAVSWDYATQNLVTSLRYPASKNRCLRQRKSRSPEHLGYASSLTCSVKEPVTLSINYGIS